MFLVSVTFNIASSIMDLTTWNWNQTNRKITAFQLAQIQQKTRKFPKDTTSSDWLQSRRLYWIGFPRIIAAVIWYSCHQYSFSFQDLSITQSNQFPSLNSNLFMKVHYISWPLIDRHYVKTSWRCLVAVHFPCGPELQDTVLTNYPFTKLPMWESELLTTSFKFSIMVHWSLLGI